MTVVSSGASGAPSVKTHISLNVAELDRSVAFYEAFFGLPAHKRRPGYANFDLADPPLKLALQEHPPTAGVGSLNHLGLQVATAAQVNAARERLIASGLASFDEGDTICCYARQDKIWAHDPDGNAWEVYFLVDDLLDGDLPGESEPVAAASAAVCCTDHDGLCCAG